MHLGLGGGRERLGPGRSLESGRACQGLSWAPAAQGLGGPGSPISWKGMAGSLWTSTLGPGRGASEGREDVWPQGSSLGGAWRIHLMSGANNKTSQVGPQLTAFQTPRPDGLMIGAEVGVVCIALLSECAVSPAVAAVGRPPLILEAGGHVALGIGGELGIHRAQCCWHPREPLMHRARLPDVPGWVWLAQPATGHPCNSHPSPRSHYAPAVTAMWVGCCLESFFLGGVLGLQLEGIWDKELGMRPRRRAGHADWLLL